jgi:MerR family transcriptional regulator, heat shock protein HspR
MQSDDADALFLISVAARIVGMHAQTLRKYERAGFLVPSRTDGRLRLYSGEDLRRLRQIKHLVEERGMNLAGVEMALEATDELRQLARDVDAVDDQSAMRSIVRVRIARLLQMLDADE